MTQSTPDSSSAHLSFWKDFCFVFFFVNMFNHPLVTGIFLLQDTEAYNKSFLNRSLYAVLSLPYGLPGNLLLIALGTFYFLVLVSSHIGLHKAQQPKVAWRRNGEKQNRHSLSRDTEAAPAITAQCGGESELARHWLITTGYPTAAIQKRAWSYTQGQKPRKRSMKKGQMLPNMEGILLLKQVARGMLTEQ